MIRYVTATFATSPMDLKKFDIEARRQKKTRSELLREIMAQYLAQREKVKTAPLGE